MNVIENRYEGGKRATQDAFWTDNVRRLLRYSLELLTAAGEPAVALGAVVIWCWLLWEPAYGRAVQRWLSGGADPAAS